MRKSTLVPGLICSRALFRFFWILKTLPKNLKKIERKHIHVFNTCVNFRQKISIFAPCEKKTNIWQTKQVNSPLFKKTDLSFLYRAQKLIFSVENLHEYWIHEYVSAYIFPMFLKHFSILKKSETKPGSYEPGHQNAPLVIVPFFIRCILSMYGFKKTLGL